MLFGLAKAYIHPIKIVYDLKFVKLMAKNTKKKKQIIIEMHIMQASKLKIENKTKGFYRI